MAYFFSHIQSWVNNSIVLVSAAENILTSLLLEWPLDLGTPVQYDPCPHTCSRSSGPHQGSPLPCAPPCCKRSRCQASHSPWPDGQIQSTCSSCSPLGCTLWQSDHTWQIKLMSFSYKIVREGKQHKVATFLGSSRITWTCDQMISLIFVSCFKRLFISKLTCCTWDTCLNHIPQEVLEVCCFPYHKGKHWLVEEVDLCRLHSLASQCIRDTLWQSDPFCGENVHFREKEIRIIETDLLHL